jgi:hypothetical protein
MTFRTVVFLLLSGCVQLAPEPPSLAISALVWPSQIEIRACDIAYPIPTPHLK